MDYKIVVARDAEEDMEHFIKYLMIEKKSMQAAHPIIMTIGNVIAIAEI